MECPAACHDEGVEDEKGQREEITVIAHGVTHRFFDGAGAWTGKDPPPGIGSCSVFLGMMI